MGAVYFYQLQGMALEQALPLLLDKARSNGWRVLVRAAGAPLRAQLDSALWQGPPASFRAHGVAGGPADADQPILLGDLPAAGFDCVMAVAGATITPDEAQVLQRGCIIFDSDDQAKALARAQWKTLSDAAVPLQYWAQEAGRWTKKAG